MRLLSISRFAFLQEMNIQSSEKEGLSLAACHRDKLLEFDRTSVRRTKVIDDESDYFTTDSRSVSYCVARYMCMLMTSNSGHVFCLCLSAICYQFGHFKISYQTFIF